MNIADSPYCVVLLAHIFTGLPWDVKMHSVLCQMSTNVDLLASNKLPNFTELGPSKEPLSYGAAQEHPIILWNPKLYYRSHFKPVS
jgi:hypothetical protein